MKTIIIKILFVFVATGIGYIIGAGLFVEKPLIITAITVLSFIVSSIISYFADVDDIIGSFFSSW